jgi:hypothetical protein
MTEALPLNTEPSMDRKFIADVHLGRLAKYLRLCGFDTICGMTLTDREIINLSKKENRIILTRDKELLKNKHVILGYRIMSENSVGQLGEVIKSYNLAKNFHPFTRCMECNGLLEDVEKEKIINRLMPKTRDFYDVFKNCQGCGKIYWEGSHYEKMKKFVDSLIINNQ